ncbi:MAG: metallophosphoesterase, partial [Planctomycetota bacterium]
MTRLALGVLVALAGTATAQDQATGIVFLDTNTNGERDAGERGIEGVAVTNGLDVVRTDAE